MCDFLGTLDVLGVSFWLEGRGFSENVVKSFADQQMDGEAVLMAMSTQSGPYCLKDVVPALGTRLKVYYAVKHAIEEEEKQKLDDVDIEDGVSIGRGSTSGVVSEENFEVQAQELQDYSSVSSINPSQNPSKKRPHQSSCEAPTVSKKTLKQEQSRTAKGSLPDPFVIPAFRVHTQNNLENEKFTESDRKHIVSVLGHVAVSHVQKVSRQLVAKALVRKYPFLVESDLGQATFIPNAII